MVAQDPETTKGPEAFAAEPSSHRDSLRVSLAGAYGREPDVASPGQSCSRPFSLKPSIKPVTALPVCPGLTPYTLVASPWREHHPQGRPSGSGAMLPPLTIPGASPVWGPCRSPVPRGIGEATGAPTSCQTKNVARDLVERGGQDFSRMTRHCSTWKLGS